MSETDGKLKRALEYHKAGRYPEAEIIYRGILYDEPNNAQTLNLLGLLVYQFKKFDEAIDYVKKAIHISPSAYFYQNLGNIYRDKGDIDEAINCYLNALDLEPSSHEISFSLGVIFKRNNDPENAINYYKKTILLKPDFQIAHYNLANVYREKKQFELAVESYNKAIELKPNDSDSYINLGIAYKELRRFDEAVDSFEKALEIKPSQEIVHLNLAILYTELNKYDKAISSYQSALEIIPNNFKIPIKIGNIYHKLGLFAEAIEFYDVSLAAAAVNPEAYFHKGLALKNIGDFDAAISCYEIAISQKNDYCEAYNNMAVAYKEKKDIEKAFQFFNKAIEIKPDYAEATFNLGKLLLLIGDYDYGWQVFDSGLYKKLSKFPNQSVDNHMHITNLEDINGKDVYITNKKEFGYGYGDFIQFVRFLPMLADAGANVILKTHLELHSLFNESELKITNILNNNDVIPENALVSNLFNLPLLFKTNLENIPYKSGYLKSNKDKVKAYKEKYFSNDKFKIGICWQGNDEYLKNRAINLSDFLILNDIENVQFYSLQKGFATEQLEEVKDNMDIINLGDEFADFSDTAAAIENLDLVISVDTSVAHLAGALGKKTWILLPFVPEWRWQLEGTDSPWYESAFLFRQKESGIWKDVLESVYYKLKVILE